MSEESKQKEKLPNRIVVKLDHINPHAYDTIKQHLLEDRMYMRTGELLAAPPLAKTILSGEMIYTGPVAIGLGMRMMASKWNKSNHMLLVNEIKKTGLLIPEFEKNYPKGWINPTNVAKTQPAFYVNSFGNLVFLKNSRQEYYRYKYQQKIGGSLWRWRAYIEPPLAPEKVRDWAKLKLQKAMEKLKELKPAPVPKPVLSPIGAFKRRN